MWEGLDVDRRRAVIDALMSITLHSTQQKLLHAYSHSVQAADLRLCRTMVFTSPVRATGPSTKRPWNLRERLDEREITELITVPPQPPSPLPTA